MKTLSHMLVAAAASMLLVACSGVEHKDVEPTSISMAEVELAESELLDVGIEIFDPGTEIEESDKKEGVFPEIRKGESRYIPVHLKNTMQRTGHWGAVRVIPTRTEATDVLVRGKILHSDGETLELAIDAHDATGRLWFSHVYEASKEAPEYHKYQRGDEDPFQDLYNTIANDLAKYKASLTREDFANIRQVSELRFAAWLAPEVFRPYLTEDEDGVWHVKRLPASDDPMLQRVLRIREREYMLIDTLTSHYDVLYANMWDPYVGWRKSRSEEMAALREVEGKALTRKILGGALIAGAIALDILAGGNNTASLRNVMLVGGAMSVKSGIDLGGQVAIHEDAIRELGVSFEAEVKPLVVEVDGETVELTGSAETQYADWRRLLKSIHFTETGLGEVNINVESPGVPQQAPPGEQEPAPVY
jgi:hypothetical protein